MFGQQNKLKELFDKHGWKLIESQIPTDWWIAEIWLIKSIWSPTECHVFLKFLVDEQLEDKTKRNSNVWAIEMSLNQPSRYWRDDNVNVEFYDDYYVQIPINRKWEKRIPEFFEELANLRSRCNNLKK